VKYYIGWDVGAWKCGKAKDDSCDSIVIMDEQSILGFHRDNIGALVRHLYDTEAAARPRMLIDEWFRLCGSGTSKIGYQPDAEYHIAIDTPLGWPRDFGLLLKHQVPASWTFQPHATNLNNSLLYRYTEREKLRRGLSVIVDSIGSQSAKGILLLELLNANDEQWGVWKRDNITLIETYPKASLVRAGFVDWMISLELKQNLTESFRVKISKKDEKPVRYGNVTAISEDVFDAAVCACVARAHATGSPKLVSPTSDDPTDYKSEGWIFYPDQPEAIADQSVADKHKVSTCGESVSTFHEALVAFRQHVTDKQARRLSIK
jgi:predicted nuclease with RNAse H fold